jgi:hypothetical protein
MEFLSDETVAAATPQQIETLHAELFEQRWNSETIRESVQTGGGFTNRLAITSQSDSMRSS